MTGGTPDVPEVVELATLRDLLKSHTHPLASWREFWTELMEVGNTLEGFETVEVIEGDDRRWSRYMSVITRGPSGQHYRWGYDHGLTEVQEDERYDDRVEAVQAIETTVVVRSWIA